MKRNLWRKILFNPLFGLTVTGWFLMLFVQDIQTYQNLQTQIRANSVLLNEAKAQQEELETQKKNLTNPDYLEFLARGKYHVTREGEQVFVFPKLSSQE